MAKRISNLISKNKNNSIDEFDTDLQALFGLLTLIVDIRYRQMNSKSFESHESKDYNKYVQSKQVLADQISPVDNGLLGL